MKSVLKKSWIILLALFILFSFSACQFRADTEEEPVTPPQEYSTQVFPDSYQMIDSVSVPTSYTGESRSDKPFNSVSEAIENTKVNRSVVSMNVQLESGVSTGSGVIVDISSNREESSQIFYIVTCCHMIEKGSDIAVFVPDAFGKNAGQTGYDSKNYVFEGKIGDIKGGEVNKDLDVSLIGADKESDIAVLRLRVKNKAVADTIVKAKIMDTRYSLKLGESVFAVGNSLGEFPGWVSTGTVAQIFVNELINEIGDMELIGINVNTYPGNSGGGLFNLYGELVGITNAGKVFSVSTKESIPYGVNYAIPHKISNEQTENGFVNIIKQLIASSNDYNFGYVSGHRVKLGFTVTKGVRSDNSVSVTITEISEDGLVHELNQIRGIDHMYVGDEIIGLTVIRGEETNYYDIVDELGIDAYEKFVAKMASLKIGDNIAIKLKGQLDSSERTVNLNIKQYFFLNTGLDSEGNPFN